MAALGLVLLHLQGRGRLRALEEHEAAILLVGLRVLLAGRMPLDEVHERQRVVGVGDGAGVVAQRQPADAAMVKLHELAVRLLALLLAQDEGCSACAAMRACSRR